MFLFTIFEGPPIDHAAWLFGKGDRYPFGGLVSTHDYYLGIWVSGPPGPSSPCCASSPWCISYVTINNYTAMHYSKQFRTNCKTWLLTSNSFFKSVMKSPDTIVYEQDGPKALICFHHASVNQSNNNNNKNQVLMTLKC